MTRKPKHPPRPEPRHAAPPRAAALPDHVVVGAFAGPHGVRGQVRLKPFTEVAADVAAYGPLMAADGRQFSVKVEGAAKGVLIARIAGIETRNAAEALKGTLLYVPRAALPETEEDEYYHADLIGLTAVRPNGVELGLVSAIHDFGAGDLLEIALTGENRTVLVPFTHEAVPEVDLSGRRLVCDPPEGLLDTEAPREDEDKTP